ncbi:conditioned medium factor [Luteimonas sp. Y-2-2-4F]|nr:choice-of-anchor X domain-containing protein [Luteimonas sp. Y-2-2-4F]MCD9033422.1 conditioned medium factor [Luteimonas sp. Y-2-2-4F]
MPERIRPGLAALLCLCAPAAFAQPVAKQLAGPPEEMAAMRAPDPAAAAILSKSALLPVTMDAAGRAALALPVENGRLNLMLLSGDGEWQAELVAPDGRALPAPALAANSRAAVLGIGGGGHNGRQLRIDGLARGAWILRLRQGAGAPARGYVLLEGDPATELASHALHRRWRPGEPLAFAATLAGRDPRGDALLGARVGRIERARLRVVAPDGRETERPMRDDGRGEDRAAGDASFAGGFVPDAEGTWIAQVVVEGIDARGTRFVRTAEHVVPVVRSALRLGDGSAAATLGDDGRLSIAVPLAARDPGRRYRVLAEVWGGDGRAAAVPVAWIGGMVEPGDGPLRLGLDPRWLARAGAQPPFELRGLRVEDADHFVPLATAERLPLALSARALPREGAAAAVAIDERMRMGPRPAVAAPAAAKAGGRLLLVHGYCSAGVWPQAQFAQASTFLDANQNRSHDQFAQRLRDFGAQWTSFGTVAHSQGGAAALHLYSYYWSGLDNAAGGRLMQSVGTPYQGTNLAGIIATIGNWFGAACGTNSNMTYDGASAWLAGIPAWARAQVHYHTTAFRTTNWWTNDYCHMASDLVLSDPEDGTVEQAYGQLPGATNRGHTVGQCHTTGMRDPAQYLDAARNAAMSANAAR